MFRTKCAGAGSVTSRGWFVCSATRSQRTRRVVYDRPMPSTESRYIPVVNILAGSVAGVFLTKLVTTNLGGWSYFVFTLATLGTFSLVRDGWSASNGGAYIDTARWRTRKLLSSSSPRS